MHYHTWLAVLPVLCAASQDPLSSAASEASAAASSQYSALESLVSSLIADREPAFTDSALSAFSSAYNKGGPQSKYLSSASSAASQASASASSLVSAASKAALGGPAITAPPSVEAIFDNMALQLNKAVEAASVQFHGSKRGLAEQASDAASSAFSEYYADFSKIIYGSTNYVDAATDSIADAAKSAQEALSSAIYGGGYTDSVAKAFASATDAAGSAISEGASSASSVASSVSSEASSRVWGPEDGTFESAVARLSKVAESAQARLKEFATDVAEDAEGKAKEAASEASSIASKVSKSASSAVNSIKEEL